MSLSWALLFGAPGPPASPIREKYTWTANGSIFQSNLMASASSEKNSVGCVRNWMFWMPMVSRALGSSGMSNHR